MSNSNKNARRKLEQVYGKGCFFTRAEIAKRIEAMGGIRTYKTFIKEKHYRGQKISHQITYHHLRHRSEGRRYLFRKWSKRRRNCSSIYAQSS